MKTITNRKKILTAFTAAGILLLSYGCSHKTIPPSATISPTKAAKTEILPATSKPLPTQTPPPSLNTPKPPKQEWIIPDGKNIQERIQTPEGFVRMEQPSESFGSFIRNYPLLPDKSPVLLYDGREKNVQTDHIAVFDMKLSPRDLQQCADSIIRIYGEYFWEKGEYDKIAFHFVNGFLCSYDKWREGYRVKVTENQVQWVKSSNPDTSLECFESYLDMVFAYASTLSLKEESTPIQLSDIQIGDLFLHPGSPGHVVMVVDICETKGGEKAFLLAQGFMPAQQFHILKNPAQEEDPWYYLSELSWPFQTPEFTFEEGTFCRLK